MAIFPLASTLRLTAVALGAASALAAAGPSYPPTPKHPVSDTYHGVTVTEDYRWLEDDASPEVKRWVAEQNAVTRGVIDAVTQRAEIGSRVAELLRTAPVRRYDFQYRGGKLFALKIDPPKNQPILVVLPSSGDVAAERVVLDPNALDPSGHTTVDFFTPSFDGKRVAVS